MKLEDKDLGILLREFRQGDETSLQKAINDEDIGKNTLTIPYPYSLEDAKSWIALCKEEDAKSVALAIDKGGLVIGGISFSNIENGEAELGYWLGKDYRRKGIMSGAVKLMIDYGFNELGLTRIYGNVFDFNIKSAGLLLKVGFTQCGETTEEKNGQKFRTIIYELTC